MVIITILPSTFLTVWRICIVIRVLLLVRRNEVGRVRAPSCLLSFVCSTISTAEDLVVEPLMHFNPPTPSIVLRDSSSSTRQTGKTEPSTSIHPSYLWLFSRQRWCLSWTTTWFWSQSNWRPWAFLGWLVGWSTKAPCNLILTLAAAKTRGRAYNVEGFGWLVGWKCIWWDARLGLKDEFWLVLPETQSRLLTLKKGFNIRSGHIEAAFV